MLRSELTQDERDKRRDIIDLNLPERLYTFLVDRGMTTIGSLTERSSKELLRYPGFGPKSLREVEEALADFGQHLTDGK